MEVIVLKYVQLVCITFFMSSNVNCAQLMIDDKEMTNLKVSACVAECLVQNVTDVSVDLTSNPFESQLFLSHPRTSLNAISNAPIEQIRSRTCGPKPLAPRSASIVATRSDY